jgi:hypothetical protein
MRRCTRDGLGFSMRRLALTILCAMVIISVLSGALYPENKATPSSRFSEDPTIDKAAEAFQKEVIIPFAQLWEKGQKLDALDLYKSRFYVILFHYYVAGEVAGIFKEDMKRMTAQLKEAQHTCGPAENDKALAFKVHLRHAGAFEGVPRVIRSVNYPSRSLPRYPYTGIKTLLSQDGRFLLFDEEFSEWSEMEVVGPAVMTLEGKYIERLFDRGRCAQRGGIWKPGGGALAFYSSINGYLLLYECGKAGDRTIPLKSPHDVRFCDWSLDGRAILFQDLNILEGKDSGAAPKREVKSEIFRWVVGGDTVTKLTDGCDARFSPDQKTIVYVGGAPKEEGDSCSGTVMVYDLLGKKSMAIALGMQPAYSPGGRRIAFVAGSEGKNEIVVYDIDKKRLFNAASAPTKLINPLWINDDEIIYNDSVPSGDELHERSDVFWVNITSGKRAQLTFDGDSLIDTLWLSTSSQIACGNKLLYLNYK